MASDVKLGKLITGNPGRDAIHVAVMPAEAGERLLPGAHVGLSGDGRRRLVQGSRPHLGIVDPFLTREVQEGEKFWLLLYKDSVTSLRHVWTHPDIPSEGAGSGVSDREYSQRWLRQYAATLSPYDDPDEAFAELVRGLLSGELFANGSDLHGFYELDRAGELKEHAERYLGITINWDKFSFGCSC